MYAELEHNMIPEQKMISDEEMGSQTTGSRRQPWLAKAVVAAGLAAALVAASIGMLGEGTSAIRAADVLGLSEDSREDNVERAKLAEMAERYDDMVDYMTKVVKSGDTLTARERNLLNIALKNAVGERRSAWRILSSLETKREGEGKDATLVADYRKSIEEELTGKVNEVLDLLDQNLLPMVADDPKPEGKVVYTQMQGDNYRYLAEVSEGDTRTDMADKSEAAYKEAMKAAEDLPLPNPIRLGLALNYAVFQHEIKEDTAKACEIAKTAFDGAIAELHDLKEDSYKDSTLFMQLLRDKLTLWTSE